MKNSFQTSLCMLLVCTMLPFFGCGTTPVKQSSSVKQTPSVNQNTPPQNVPSPALIRSSHLKFELTATSGVKRTIYFYASDEKVEQASDASCYGNRGNHLRSGTYSLYLDHGGDTVPELQNVPLFTDSILAFNDEQKQFDTYKGDTKHVPDLLTVTQQSSCNGKLLALFSLTSTAEQVKQIRFQTPDALKETLFVSEIKRLSNTMFQTLSYNNATGLYTRITWNWDIEHNQFVQAEKTESKRI